VGQRGGCGGKDISKKERGKVGKTLKKVQGKRVRSRKSDRVDFRAEGASPKGRGVERGEEKLKRKPA